MGGVNSTNFSNESIPLAFPLFQLMVSLISLIKSLKVADRQLLLLKIKDVFSTHSSRTSHSRTADRELAVLLHTFFFANDLTNFESKFAISLFSLSLHFCGFPHVYEKLMLLPFIFDKFMDIQFNVDVYRIHDVYRINISQGNLMMLIIVLMGWKEDICVDSSFFVFFFFPFSFLVFFNIGFREGGECFSR